MAIPLRDITPTRRLNRKILKHYTSYRKTLSEDFQNRCGYCGSFDRIFKRTFAIDHFIPQNPSGFTHTLAPNNYYNLVYSCGYCNSSKLNKWPTMDVTKANDGKKGFLDPVDPIYDTMFSRHTDGTIYVTKTTNPLSVYIYTEINLKNHVHSIIWKLETVDNSIRKLKNLITHQGRNDLQTELNLLLSSYHDLTSSLFS